ncbi:MAG: hypothetical protein ACI81V_001025 [Lentimonas sp.]|jgi:hypothetical protein
MPMRLKIERIKGGRLSGRLSQPPGEFEEGEFEDTHRNTRKAWMIFFM